MDVSKVQKAIADAQTEVNGLIDGSFKARQMSALRTLDLASKALALAATHVTKAAKQSEPKAAPAPKAKK